MAKYFRENIQMMQGYVPGEQPKGKKLLKLNTNENPYEPSAAVVNAIRNMDFVGLKRYPPPFSDIVRDAAEKVYNVPQEQIIVGNGSDDILTILFRSFVDQGAKVGWFSPSYSLYSSLAEIQGSVPVEVPLDTNFSFPKNANAMLSVIAFKAKDCKLFFITRPNAPTGNAFEKSMIISFIEHFQGVVCIDEAYVDFCEDNCLDLIDMFPNVVITRSLSKSYSLAGIRCGLGLSNRDIIQGMHKVRDSYNVNSITQIAAAAALLDREAFIKNVSAIKSTRQRVSKELENLGFSVCPSEANFIFCIPPIDAKTFVSDVRETGYLIRYFNKPGIDQYVRISIGSDIEMKEFMKAVELILQRRAA